VCKVNTSKLEPYTNPKNLYDVMWLFSSTLDE
jgi:hypothetical protein